MSHSHVYVALPPNSLGEEVRLGPAQARASPYDSYAKCKPSIRVRLSGQRALQCFMHFKRLRMCAVHTSSTTVVSGALESARLL